MDLIICFIDDSEFEHDIVRNQIAPIAPELEFVQAFTFEEARKVLGSRIPGLFLLDLWGQDHDVAEPCIPTREELESRVLDFNNLEDVYNGLYDFQGDRINEYLKRLFRILDSWRTLFSDACDRIGQNRKYGLANLQQARRHYPGVPAVFYTRKSLISDAVAIFAAGSDGLFIKPTGRDDNDTRSLTIEYAPELIRGLARIVQAGINNLKEFESFYQTENTGKGVDIYPIIESWKKFSVK